MKNTHTRGLRNNNPLNLRHSASRWQGMRPEQTDKDFVQFRTMAWGYRAAWITLETYWKRFNKAGMRFTPHNILQRWAPPQENNTAAYLRTVCMLSGLGGNEALARPSRAMGHTPRQQGMRQEGTLREEQCISDEYTATHPQEWERLALLVAAMASVECGIPMRKVSGKEIRKGYTRAFG